jgi:phage terminase large subunit-like protein
VRALPPEQRTAILSSLSDEHAAELLYDWPFWARPEQLPPPGDWRVWLILTGRGWGKSRAGAEYIRAQAESGRVQRMALIGQTPQDIRDTMIEGDSGILAVSPPWFMPEWNPSKLKLVWPNGCQALIYSAETPRHLRGPQFQVAWCDELASWKYLRETWDMLAMTMRKPESRPRIVITTTPKPLALLIDIAKRPTTVVTRGRTLDNAENLHPEFLAEVQERYAGTRLGRQELDGELLEDAEGALWQRAQIDALRVDKAPDLQRVVVAIDPAMTAGEDSDETGIIAAGVGVDGHGYVLRDASCRLSPDGWAQRAVALFDEAHADRIVAEVNNGGEMVEHTLRTVRRMVPYQAVHASRGKVTRAEPIAALYEQGKIHHAGSFLELEDQMCTFVPGDLQGSPDRVDALVWALTWLFVTNQPGRLMAKPRGA